MSGLSLITLMHPDNDCSLRMVGYICVVGCCSLQGTLTLPNGDRIEGHFNGSFNEGIKITGVFHKGTEPVTERKGFTHALGLIPKLVPSLTAETLFT